MTRETLTPAGLTPDSAELRTALTRMTLRLCRAGLDADPKIGQRLRRILNDEMRRMIGKIISPELAHSLTKILAEIDLLLDGKEEEFPRIDEAGIADQIARQKKGR